MKPGSNYKDLFRVVYGTLQPAKLISQAAVLAAAGMFLLIFLSLSDLFQASLSFFPVTLRLLGWIGAYLILIAGAGPLARLNLEEWRRQRTPPLASAWSGALKSSPALLLSTLGPLSFALAMALVLVFLNLLARIPGAGPVLWALSIIPQFFAGIFLAAGLLTLLAGTILLPSIAAANPGAGGVDLFHRLASLMRRDFFRFWGYLATTLALGALSFALVTLLFMAAARIVGFFSVWAGGQSAGRVLLSIPELFENLPSGWQAGYPFPGGLPPGGVAYSLGGALAGVSLLGVYVLWLSYPVLYLFSSGTVIYLAVSGRRDSC